MKKEVGLATPESSPDYVTAQAFATSWNNRPAGSAYTFEQFTDWMEPWSQNTVESKEVLELGCGDASLLSHLTAWKPKKATGIDLGDSVVAARRNLKLTGYPDFEVLQSDLVSYRGSGHDAVFSIGVLHHLKDPRAGFESVIANVKPGGRFHCWVYAREGNDLIILIVEPLRKFFCHFPWWFVKYGVANTLVIPFFLYAHCISRFPKRWEFAKKMPLYLYSLWITKRPFSFFRQVAFDQLVTPQTTYIAKETIEEWLKSDERISPESTYIIMRNGNSWKFGGQIKA